MTDENESQSFGFSDGVVRCHRIRCQFQRAAGRRPGGPLGGREGMMRMNPLLNTYSDGVIDAQEIATAFRLRNVWIKEGDLQTAYKTVLNL